MYLRCQQDGLRVARWHAVTVRRSGGSPLAEGAYLSFCPEEVTKSSLSSERMEACSTTCITSQERGHRPTPSFTCKRCLKISANIMTLWQERHPMSSCSLAECLVQVQETECPQLLANPVTVHPPALTSSGRFEYL